MTPGHDNYPAPMVLPHPCQHEGDISVLNAALAEIKDTLRDLKDLLASNAALEEQAIITRNSLKEINERLRSVELEQARSKGNSKWTDRILWAITSAALGLLLGMASGKLAI